MSVVSLRYANALASVAKAQHLDAAVVRQQLDDFADTLAESRELREVLGNPSIASEQKLKVLDAIAGRIGMFGPLPPTCWWITCGYLASQTGHRLRKDCGKEGKTGLLS